MHAGPELVRADQHDITRLRFRSDRLRDLPCLRPIGDRVVDTADEPEVKTVTVSLQG